MGGGPEQEHFVDGVTESLTTDLSRIRGVVVIARNTAFTYKSKPLRREDDRARWTPFVGPRTVGIKVESRLLFPFSSSSKSL